MPKKHNPILVEWIDSAQPIAAWMFLENKPGLEIVECVKPGSDESFLKPGSDESFSQALRQAYWDLHDDPRYGLVV